MNRSQRREIMRLHPFRWEPWERGVPTPLTPAQVQEIARRTSTPVERVQATVDEGLVTDVIWVNDVYQVAIRHAVSPPQPWDEPLQSGEANRTVMVHLSIKRRDRRPVGIERFNHFQQIKKDLLGAEYEAVELYPAESRLVDGAHQYHLWVLPKEGMRFPFGFNGGRLTTVPISEPDGEHPGT